MLVASDVLFCR